MTGGDVSTMPIGVGAPWVTDSVRCALDALRDLHQVESPLSSALTRASLASHNKAFLINFLVDQLSEHRDGGDLLRRIVERDFGGQQKLHEAWTSLATDDAAAWIVLGLSFQDFRFHLFSLSEDRAPFCVTPVLCWCAQPEIVRASNQSRTDLLDAQWRDTNWWSAEQRLACLSKPLDLFEEPQGCVTGACEPTAT